MLNVLMMLLGRYCTCFFFFMIDKSFCLRSILTVLHYGGAFVISSIETQSACYAVQTITYRELLSASHDRVDVLQRHRRLLFSPCPEIQDFFSCVDMLICYRCI